MQVADRESRTCWPLVCTILILKGLYVWRQTTRGHPTQRRRVSLCRSSAAWPTSWGILPQRVEVVGEGEFCFGNLLAVEVKAARRETAARTRPLSSLASNELGGIGICVHSVQELETQLRPFVS